jgi:hypothetical protein
MPTNPKWHADRVSLLSLGAEPSTIMLTLGRELDRRERPAVLHVERVRGNWVELRSLAIVQERSGAENERQAIALLHPPISTGRPLPYDVLAAADSRGYT